MAKYPGWRTMTAAQRRNARMDAMFEEARARRTPGQLAYEADCMARPNYHDGTPRKWWSQLGELERQSWEPRQTETVISKGNGARQMERWMHSTNQFRVVGDTLKTEYSTHRSEQAAKRAARSLARKWGWSHPGSEPLVQRRTSAGWETICGYTTADLLTVYTKDL